MPDLPKEFIDLCHSISAKRPKTVIDHILKHGFITTEDLKNKYGYNHPPRAVRDVREQRIPIETFRVSGSDGRSIAAYRFGDIETRRFQKLSGRTGLSKKIKEALVEKYGCKCFIYLETVEERDLQIDHRVPYEVGGDGKERNSIRRTSCFFRVLRTVPNLGHVNTAKTGTISKTERFASPVIGLIQKIIPILPCVNFDGLI